MCCDIRYTDTTLLGQGVREPKKTARTHRHGAKMISTVLGLLTKWQTSVHVALWHNALVDQHNPPCDICRVNR